MFQYIQHCPADQVPAQWRQKSGNSVETMQARPLAGARRGASSFHIVKHWTIVKKTLAATSPCDRFRSRELARGILCLRKTYWFLFVSACYL